MPNGRLKRHRVQMSKLPCLILPFHQNDGTSGVVLNDKFYNL